VCPEFLLWAVSGSGIAASRRSYEVLETYGDTILKLAATICAYNIFKSDAGAGEGELENTKVLFVTNFNTYRVGYHVLKSHRFIKLCRDTEAKDWSVPLQGREPRHTKCTGKSMADSVESLIGAHFLSNDSLFHTLRWINDIKLVPLQALDKLDQFK
jgi:dsRNA-specific ribonuclease